MVPIVEKDRETTTCQYDLAVAHRMMAECYYKSGNTATALENVERPIKLINDLKAQDALRDADKHIASELEQEKLTYSK